MLGTILFGVAGVVVLFVALVATRPSAYRVERALQVNASADRVFALVNDLRHFAGFLVLFGSPLDKADPKMRKTFEGPAAGVGQSYAWSGNKDVGAGTLTIEQSVAAQQVIMTLQFVKPMASTATCALTLAGTPAGSSVTWSMDGNHNLVGKAAGIFMNMDKMLGGDIEKGLALLKAAAEAGPHS